MRLWPHIFLILCLVYSAKSCEYFREFSVENCSACPILDETRPGVQMAVCEKRVSKNGGEMTHACVCGRFPRTLEPALFYYPQRDGNLTKCTASWAAAPELFTTLTVVYVLIMLYALAHVSYIIALSRIRCNKNNSSALSLAVGWIFHVVLKLWRIATQGEIEIGYSSAQERAWLAHGFAFLQTGYYACLFLAIPFYITSMSGVIFPGEEWAVRRRIINTTLFFLAVVTGLSYIVVFVVSLQSNAQILSVAARICGLLVTFSSALLFVIANVFMYLAVRSMRETVRTYGSSQSKPTIIVKLNKLCVAICRFWWPMQVLWFTGFMVQVARGYCLQHLGAINNWVSKNVDDIVFGFGHVLFACLLEGKPVPTFPMKACRKRNEHKLNTDVTKGRETRALSGLQFSDTLAKAMELVRKYGLESERHLQSPVEVAIESLLSTSTLEVAASPEMDLFSSIEYFLNESKLILEKFDASKLRFKTKRCLKWAKDPTRPATATTTVDEAAAIMLYTQQTCLYPLLNSALRDHMNPEKLAPFLPYFKLLLTALYKLPLLRTQTYRTVKLDLHEQYNQLQGKVFTWWAFSSSTLLDDLFAGSVNDRTMFIIDAIGVDISMFSAHPDEQEVLLLPGTPLMVKPGVNVETGYWKFEASVWSATQHKRRQQMKQTEEKTIDRLPSADDSGASELQYQNIDFETEEKTIDRLTPADDSSASELQYQNIDFPHPGWEKLVFMEGIRSPALLSPQTPR